MITPDPEARRAKRGIVRSVAWLTPAFIASTASAVLLLANNATGGASLWVLFALTALFALLFGVPALAAWRDLFADPRDSEGYIDRKWTKSDLFVFRGHYVKVDKRIFRIRKSVYHDMPGVGDRVYLHHYPHTNALVRWQHIDTPALPDAPPAPDVTPHMPPSFNPTPPPERVEPPAFGGRRDPTIPDHRDPDRDPGAR